MHKHKKTGLEKVSGGYLGSTTMACFQAVFQSEEDYHGKSAVGLLRHRWQLGGLRKNWIYSNQ